MDAITREAPSAQSTTVAAPDYLRLANDAFDASTTYFDSSIRKQIESNIRQFQGVHPAGSKYFSDAYRNRSRLFRPKTRAVIRKNEAVASEALFSTTDPVAIDAQNDDDPDQLAGAALMKALVKYRLEKSIPWFLLAMGAYQDTQAVGACLSYQYWEYEPKKKKDKPCIELLPLENFRFDPAASWLDPINTSPYNIRLIPMYVKDVKARMRDSQPGNRRWKKYEDSQLLSAARAYSDTTRQTRERGRTDSTEQPTAITNFTIIWVHQVVMEIDGEDFVWYTLGKIGMLSDPVPIKEVWWHGRRPFVMGYCVIETHKNYPGGVAELVKDVQAEINEVANQRIDNVKFAMNKRYFVKRTNQVDLRSLTRNVPGSVTLMQDPEKDVKVQETQDVTSSAYQEQDRLNLDFDDVAGAFSPSSIQSNRKLNETVGGMNLLTANSNQVGAYQLKTFVETWVEPVIEQLCWLESHYESDQEVLQLAGAAARLVEEFNLDAIDDVLMHQDLTITVDVGQSATNPQERLNNFLTGMRAVRELLMDGVLERYGLDVGDVIREVFSKLGYKTGKRFFDAAMDPALNAAQATIQDLQAQLAQKVDPALVAKQIEKLEAEIVNLGAKNHDIMMSALEKALRGFFAAHQTAQMVAAVPEVAKVGDAVLDSAAVMSGNPPTAGAIQPPAAPAAGLAQNSVVDPRTGVEFTPGGAVAGDTTPNTPGNPSPPAMPTPGTGATGGIETMRNETK
jgi:hypothetical protein